MGFEKTEDKQKSAVEGFETDAVDLDGGGSEGIRAVKAPRRSSRKEPRFGQKRDRLGRKETNTDDSPDNDEMVAPVRPVRLSGSGGGHMSHTGHIQKPVMKEGSDFAYLFTDQDDDQNDRHMDREKASRLDGLAYDEKTDGDGEKYSELFAQAARQPSGGNGRTAAAAAVPASQERPEPETVRDGNGAAPVFTAKKAVIPEPAPQEPPQTADSGGQTKKRSIFNRHSRSAEKKEKDGAPAFTPRGAGERDTRDMYPDGRYDRYRDDGYGRDGYGRDGYGRDGYNGYDGYNRDGYNGYYDEGRDRRYDRPYDDGYDRGYDRYHERDRGYDYDYDYDYDRRYDRREEEEEYLRHARADRYRRAPYEPEPYEAEPVYPPAGYQVMPGMYPSMMGGYQPVYYTPAPVAPVQPVQPVQYVQGAVYGVPVQGAPYQGVPVTGVPVQAAGIPAQAAPVQTQPVQPVTVQDAPASGTPVQPEEAAAENGAAKNDLPASGEAPGSRGGSRFNRRGPHDRSREQEPAAQSAPAVETAPGEGSAPDRTETPPEASRSGQSQEERPEDRGYDIPTEDSIPHFRPRQHGAARNDRTPAAQPGRADAPAEASAEQLPDGDASSGNKPAEPRFRRRHN